MNDEIDILANSKWKSTCILNRVAKIKTTVSKIEQHDTLLPENWKDIIYLSEDLCKQVDELQKFATCNYQKMIGG